jgi:signal transduction histidine kinase
MYKPFLLLFFFIFSIFSVYSQSFVPTQYEDYIVDKGSIDSLERAISNQKEIPEAYLNGLLCLGQKRMLLTVDQDKDLDQIKELLEKFPSSLATAMYNYQQAVCLKDKDLSRSIVCANEATQYFEVTKDTLGMMSCYRLLLALNLNDMFEEKGNSEKAKAYYAKLINLGNLSNNFRVKIKQINLILSHSYFLMDKRNVALEDAALKEGERIIAEHQLPKIYLVSLYLNASNGYYYFQKFDKMLACCLKLYQLNQNEKSVARVKATSNLSVAYFCNNNPEKSAFYQKEAIGAFLELKIEEPNLLRNLYSTLADIQFKQKKYDEAWETRNIADTLYAKYETNIRGKEFLALQTKYETEKKENENTLLIKEKQQLWNVVFLVSLLAIVVGGLLLYGYYTNSKLKKALQFKQNLFTIVAHDLRHPLTGFQDLADLLNYHIRRSNFDKLQNITEAIDKSSIALRILLDNLFQWLATEQYEMVAKPSLIAVLPHFRNTFEQYEHIMKQKKVVVRIECSDDVMVYANEKEFAIIARNLIDNALKALPKETPLLTLEVEPDLQHKQTIIRIKNNGEMVEDAKLLHINQLFQKHKQHQPFENNIGLGLWLVAKYMQKNKGKITCSVKKDTAETMVCLTLPSGR